MGLDWTLQKLVPEGVDDHRDEGAGKLCKVSNPAEIESCASAEGSAGSSLYVGTRVGAVSKKRSSFEEVKANSSRCSEERKLFSPQRLEAKGSLARCRTP